MPREIKEVSNQQTERNLPEPPPRRAWIVRAQGDERKYVGNHGYADELGARYCYDSFVPNCRQIDVGHVFIVRSKRNLEGVALVRDIESWQDTKNRQVCPDCKRPTIELRKTTGDYACHECHKTFPQPESQEVDCIKFVATYEGAAVLFREETPVSLEMIAAVSTSFNRQNSILPIDLAKLTGPEWQKVREALA
jgi:ribosomal protein L37AE/L43A